MFKVEMKYFDYEHAICDMALCFPNEDNAWEFAKSCQNSISFIRAQVYQLGPYKNDGSEIPQWELLTPILMEK